ncbi:MAG: DUF6320 domain-containing protein [Christensenellales bacterium]|jgi:hypothetical protein
MSYCVNCGVKLEETQKKCPLCDTEVVNPRQPVRHDKKRPYPPRLHRLQARVNWIFWGRIVTVAIIGAAIIFLLSELLYSGWLSWSAYGLASLAFLWVVVAVPLFMRTPTALKCLAIDFLALIGFLFVIQLLSGGGWFVPLALPIILLAGCLALVIVTGVREKILKGLYFAAALTFAAALMLVGIEILIQNYVFRVFRLSWSLFAAVPVCVAGIILIVIERNMKLKNRIIRRLHM